MKNLGDVIWGIGILILVYLIVAHGPAVNALLVTTFKGAASLSKTLQGR